MKANDKRIMRMRALRWGRLAVQVAFFLALPSLFSAGFNGFKYLFTSMGTGAPIEAASFLVTLAVLLAVTIVFGRVFCGFACAFGTLGDVLHQAFAFLWKRTPFPMPVWPQRVVGILSGLKYVVLAAIAVACFLGLWSAVSMDSPWVAFAALLSGSWEGVGVAAFVLLGLIAVGMMVRERFFCQFLCPLGALFSLMPALGPLGFTRNPSRCPKNCGLCHKNCPVSIWPDADTYTHGECIACGRCAAVCPLSNVSLLSVGENARADAVYTARKTGPRKAALLSLTFFIPAVAVAVCAGVAVTAHPAAVETDFEIPDVSALTLETRALPEERDAGATLALTLPPEALDGSLKDGTYTGAALCGKGNDEDWQPYYIVVEIEVKDGRVAGITDVYGDAEGSIDPAYVYDAAENSLYLDRALEGTGGRFSKGALDQIEEFLASGAESGDVDTVSGSTFSVMAICQAYSRAVDEAVEQSANRGFWPW